MKPIIPLINKTLFALYFCALCFICPPAFADNDKLFGAKEPIVITSLSMTADNRANNALFEGSVIATTGKMKIFSDKMLVFYDESGKVTKIEADGQVKLIRGERVITSEAAVYFAKDESLIFTGQPRAIEGGSLVSGTKMIYMMKEDRYRVENSKVFIQEKKGK